MLHFFLPKQRFSHIYFYKNSKGKEMTTENDADEFLKTQPGTGLQDSIHKEQPYPLRWGLWVWEERAQIPL